LTPREREIALLVAAGLDNQDIGYRACCSPETIRVHLNHCFKKLGITHPTVSIRRLLLARLIWQETPSKAKGMSA